MPQVPYTPYPTQSPFSNLAGPIHVETPPAAFGVTIGQAIEGVGRQAEQGGNELFQRAVALQQLQNETEAKEADAQYMIGAGQRHAQFSSLEGKAAVDAYPQYIKDLQDMRQQYRAGLSNDMARRMFDSSSLSVMSRTIFNGAGYSATQNKAWVGGVAHTNAEAARNLVFQNPEDEGLFKEALTKAYDKAAINSQLHGYTAEQFQDEIQKEYSHTWGQRIEALARTKPNAAQEMLNQNRDKLQGTDLQAAEQTVKREIYNTGARNISHNVNVLGSVDYGRGVVSMDRAKQAISAIESGGDYDNVTDSKTRHGNALGKYQIMEDELQGDLARAGLDPMSPKEFLQDHAAQERVFEAKFGGDMQKYGSFNEAAARWIGLGPSGDRFGTTWQKYVARANQQLAKTASLEDKVGLARSQAEAIRPDDPIFSDHVAQVTEAGHNKIMAEQRDQELRDRNTIAWSMNGGDSGKIPTTQDELLVNPQVRAAWDRMAADRDGAIQQGKILKQLSLNAKGDYRWTPESQRRWVELMGMADQHPDDFLNVDMLEEKMPWSAKQAMVRLQIQKKEKADADPRVAAAMNQLGPELYGAGITRQDKDQWNHFTGSLQQAIEDFQREHKAPPKEADIKLIGARLMQQETQPYRFLGMKFGGSEPLYNVPVPDDKAEAIRADPAWKQLGITPSDEMVRRIYIQKEYQRLYGGSVKKEEPAGPIQSAQVPQSK